MSNAMKWVDRDEGPVNYGEPTYWEKRYQLDRKEFGTSHRHDWYCEFDKLMAILESYFGQPKGQRILIVGCGLSNIASEMHAMGYRCITAIDISATSIALMQAGDQDKEGIEYAIGDARKMYSFPDGLFDCIFDKGCADSLICGYRSTDDVVDMFHECCRVLRPGGVFVCISHGDPDARIHMFQHDGLQWHMNAIPMHGSEGLFVYVCTKWSQDEIEAAERTRLDNLESMVAMRTRSVHSRSTRGRRGVMHQNLIAHVRPPHEIEAAKQQREERLKEEAIKNAASSAKTTTESSVVPIDAGDSAQRSLVTRQGSQSLGSAGPDSQTSHEHSTAVVVDRFQPGMTAVEDISVNVLASG